MHDAQRTTHTQRNDDPLVSTSEAAEYIGVHPSTIRRWLEINPKAISHHRTVGGHRRFRLTNLDKFIEGSE